MTVARELVDEIVAAVMGRLAERSAACGARGCGVATGSAPDTRDGMQPARTGVRATPQKAGESDAAADAGSGPRSDAPGTEIVRVDAVVVTADVLRAALDGEPPPGRLLRVPRSAILTPAARDLIRAWGLKCLREQEPARTSVRSRAMPGAAAAEPGPRRCALVIVHGAPALLTAWETLARCPQWHREMCDGAQAAAEFCIREMARGGLERAVIAANEPDHAACLANRHRCVRATVVQNAVDVRAALRRWQPNVFCVRPDDRLVFAWTQLFEAVARADV